MQETVRNIFGYDEEFVNPTTGPFTEDDLKISEDDVKGFIKRNKNAPKGLVNQMLFDMANPQYTRYGESKTLTGLGTKSSLEAIKDQLIAEALYIDAQKKASKKAATVPAEYGLMSPKNVMASVNNNLNRSGILMPLGMDAEKAPAIGAADKPTDPRTLTGPITGTDVLKSLSPFDSSVGKLRYETGQILSRLPGLEIVTGGPGGATFTSGINLRGLASLGDEFLTQSTVAKAKKMGTKLGADFLDEFLKLKQINVNKLPQKQQDVAKLLENNPKNVPLIKVNDLGIKEELAKLDVVPTPAKTIDDTSLVKAYTGEYREGYGHGEKKAVDSFIISDSATSVGLKAKDVKTPYTGFKRYEHPQVVGEKYEKEPLYGHVRTIDLKRLAGGDIHPNIDVEAKVLGQKNEFLSPEYGLKDFDFLESKGFWNPEAQMVTTFKTPSGEIKEVPITKDVNKELNNFGIDEKNMLTEIEPEAVVKSDFSAVDMNKLDILKELLNMRIRMQRLHALVRFIDIPKLEVLQKTVPLGAYKEVPIKDREFFGEKISALPKTAFYNFDDILNKIKSAKNLDTLRELENYIVGYTKASIKNSLTTDAVKGSPNVLSDIWLNSIPTNTGTKPGDYFYTKRNDVSQGMIQNKFNGPLLMDHPHFRNPLSHKVIYGTMGQLSQIYAQKNVLNFDLRKPIGTPINLRDTQANLLNAVPRGGDIPYSTALKNLIKHEELEGEKLYNLYKKATLSDKNIETLSSSGEAITTREAEGFVPTAGKLRNDIQTAEKNWGSGENILRFSEEQYDTFSSKNFKTADDMLSAMRSKKVKLYDLPVKTDPEFDLSVSDIAFANFRNKPEHLVELTTLHNIKKAIENNYDVVQFNTFNTQAKLSGWSQSLFEGRRDAMRDYFLSGFTGDKALNANDKALLTIINNSIDEKVFQRLKSKKGIDYDNEILTGDANLFRHSETNYDTLRKLPKKSQNEYLKAVKKAMDEKDIDGKVINALKGVSDDIIVDVFDATSYLIRMLHTVPLQPKYKDLPLIKRLNKAKQTEFISGKVNANGVNLVDFKKEVLNELFSPETAKAVTPTEFKYTGVLGGFSSKLDEFGILLYQTKQKILKNSFEIEMGNTPTNENIAKRNMNKVFHKKYKDSFPTEEALTKAIVSKTNDKGNSIYAELNHQYGKNKMKALEKFGLQPKIITDTKNNVTRSFIEINLGKTKKEKLDLLERLNNYEVKLYSRVNPVPTFNEVAEEELTTEAENKTAVPAFM